MDAAPTASMRSKTSRRMKVCGEPVSRSATQPKGARTPAPLWIAIVVVKEAWVEGNVALDEAGAVFWQREGGVDTTCDSQNLGAVISRRVRKIVRTLQGGVLR